MHFNICLSHRSCLFYILAAAFLLLLAGCGSRQSSTSSNKPTESVKTTVAGSKSKGNAKTIENAKPDEPAVKPIEDTGPKLELSQRGVTLNWVEKGVLRMSATASKGQISEITKVGMLFNFSAKLYDNGKLTTTMTAPKVIADTTNRIVTATGGVTLKSLDRKTVVKAKWMKWYEKKQKVVGNGGVDIKSDTWNVQSAAFIADTALKNLSVQNSAEGLDFK